MNMRRAVILAVVLLAFASRGIACEPVIPFIVVVGGPALITRSLYGLLAAVGLKCILFAIFEKRLSHLRSAVFMLVGNVLTTFIGLLAAIMMGSGGMLYFGAVVVWALCWMPAKRLVIAEPRARMLTAPGVATAMTAALVVSCLLFSFGGLAAANDLLALYWLFKLSAVYLALLASILLTALWEEWVIWKLSRDRDARVMFFKPVLRANIYVLLLMMTIAAAMILPARLKSPDFLVKLRTAEARQ